MSINSIIVEVGIEIRLIALLDVSIDEVKAFEVKHMESLSAHDTNVAIFVKPLLHVLASLIATAYLNHVLCWLAQVELLVVEEAISTPQLRKVTFLRAKPLDL